MAHRAPYYSRFSLTIEGKPWSSFKARLLAIARASKVSISGKSWSYSKDSPHFYVLRPLRELPSDDLLALLSIELRELSKYRRSFVDGEDLRE